MTLKINFCNLNLAHRAVNAKFGGMYASFFDALRELGCEVVYTNESPTESADVLVVPMGGGQEHRSLRAMHRFGGPSILYVPPAAAWFDRWLLRQLRAQVLFAYGTDASSFSKTRYAEVGMRYHFLPFASDPRVMRPLGLPPQYDVVFVGSMDHAPRRLRFVQHLVSALGSRTFLCVGSGWRQFGIPDQLIAWGPFLNVVYNLGRVCVNMHTEEQVQGPSRQLDLNNRVFDLAMAGTAQVCDSPEAVGQHFGESEVVTARTSEEWITWVLRLLDDPDFTDSLRCNALARARRDHTWNRRASEFVTWARASHEDYLTSPPSTVGLWLRTALASDTEIVEGALRRLLPWKLM